MTNFLKLANKALRLAALLMLCLAMFCWSVPAQAASRISPQLEEQVLQILRQHPEVILESVQAYQEQQQKQIQQTRQAFVEQIKTNPKAVIGESPTTGASEPKIVLLEFSDFECPYCSKANTTLKQFIAKHQDEVTLVYKHFPLISIHPEAMSAAKAAWAAGQQGKFWEYHDALFTQQDKLGEALYLDIAQNMNLDLDKFDRDRNLADTAIQKDMQLAERLGLSGTPFFVMNGEIFSGAVQLSDMENILARVSKS
ncbi:DsbA family protein [Argonema antarcticum]|uniref:DsbA family protein n=1 Tax=Argonema antarcticum TaxID=2942763 RepID=UPI0020114A20|nr:thioredoxin domain-containing protein [Argonema antarcticum]MCL1473979.1 thioredoxin domain-containing protein [Argonema antarcticum A004/B2]